MVDKEEQTVGEFHVDDFNELKEGVEYIKFIDEVCAEGVHTGDPYPFAVMVEGRVKRSIQCFDNVMKSLAKSIEGLEYKA